MTIWKTLSSNARALASSSSMLSGAGEFASGDPPRRAVENSLSSRVYIGEPFPQVDDFEQHDRVQSNRLEIGKSPSPMQGADLRTLDSFNTHGGAVKKKRITKYFRIAAAQQRDSDWKPLQ